MKNPDARTATHARRLVAARITETGETQAQIAALAWPDHKDALRLLHRVFEGYWPRESNIKALADTLGVDYGIFYQPIED